MWDKFQDVSNETATTREKKTFETFCIISVSYILKYVQETKMFIIIIIIIIIISWL